MPGLQRPHRPLVQPEPGHHAGPEPLHQHVGLLSQGQRPRRARRRP